MHGEYKTPGGKLVVVDFAVCDGNLCDVEVSGDFFLYPEEVLGAITDALEGMPAGTGESAMAGAIGDALPDGAEVLGTSPQGIAIAVQRALGAEAGGGPAGDG